MLAAEPPFDIRIFFEGGASGVEGSAFTDLAAERCMNWTKYQYARGLIAETTLTFIVMSRLDMVFGVVDAILGELCGLRGLYGL